jgi:hypothetical protein
VKAVAMILRWMRTLTTSSMPLSSPDCDYNGQNVNQNSKTCDP